MNPENPQPQLPEKSNQEVLYDLLKEVAGVEHGLWYTIRRLRNDPAGVVNGYLRGDLNYSSPFRLLISVLTVWLLVNGFMIDWYAIWEKFMDSYLTFLYNNIVDKKISLVTFHEKMSPFRSLFVQFGGDLFAKIYIPFVMLVLPLSAWFAQKITRKYAVSFRMLMAVNGYVMGANGVVFLVMSVLIALNFYVFLGLGIILIILSLFGVNFLTMIPPRKFFDQHGLEIERGIMRSNMLAVMLIISLLFSGYVVWFLLR
jgi:hypothetical protein